jgi:SNF2 family DNA or RNA helicase
MVDEIKEYSKKNSKISMISSTFTLFAFEKLKKELSKIDEFKFVFTEPTFVSKEQEMKEFYINKNNNVFGTEFEIKLRNEMTQSSIAKECAEWIKKKATFKSFKKRNPAYPRLMHIENKDDTVAMNGSVDFTADSLGIVPSTRIEAINAFYGKEHTRGMLQAFENIWNSDDELDDVTDLVIKNLNIIHKENPPEFIYFVTLYNIFFEYLSELTDDRLVKEKTGIKETVIWNKLYQFQKDGVLGAIEKIENYNGCIIADSVGLGKTFSALAIIKYYELRNYRVLVLCPKKLRDNWLVYTMNDKRNIFVNDRFSYDVLNHTDLSRESGYSGDINLSTLNWENYDLVVIDESHNFRNNPPVKDHKTRYQRLMEDVIKSGVQTKVLMLSATPVNNKMNDIKNQIAFITEENDQALQEVGIDSINHTLKNAQMIYNRWANLTEKERTTETFVDMMNMDYFTILDTLTIARSRKHIEKYYDIEEIGSFPDRLKPLNKYSKIDENGIFPDISEINNTINKLNLAIYSPLKYVYHHKLVEYERKYDMEVKGGQSLFRQRDRETSLIHLMRVNILKRLESSVHSFTLTLSKILEQINNILQAIKQHNEGYSTNTIKDISILDIDPDDTLFEDLLVGNKVKVLLQDTDTVKWKQELKEDKVIIEDLLSMGERVEPEKDSKLNMLKDTIIEKITNPINEGNRKVIIFTTFSDTAKYLYDNLATHAKELNMNAALVVGSGTNKSTLEVPTEYKNQIKFSDINTVLTLFSPESKEAHKVFPNMQEEIDILIATDCISEGQNLQDCDFVINYDIHWNPVRIIQRFGRVDRLGSQNERIQLVNFWPTQDLDEYINLEQRVKGRMVLVDVSATGEENPVESNQSKEMRDLLYRRNQLKKLKEEVVDLEDISGGISITDLSFSDFRVDLTGYLKNNRKKLEQSPTGLYSIVRIPKEFEDELKPGVIFLLEQVSGEINNLEKNSLHPFYLIYVTDDQEIRLSYDKGKQLLDIYKKTSHKNDKLDTELIKKFNQLTDHGSDMSHYSSLLDKAIEEIVGKKEELGVTSLFHKGGTSIVAEDVDGLEDFELISFLILDS